MVCMDLNYKSARSWIIVIIITYDYKFWQIENLSLPFRNTHPSNHAKVCLITRSLQIIHHSPHDHSKEYNTSQMRSSLSLFFSLPITASLTDLISAQRIYYDNRYPPSPGRRQSYLSANNRAKSQPDGVMRIARLQQVSWLDFKLDN